MECTQRLECTQELYQKHTERLCPEQIGFLGICGAKHPVVRGPNKIGRDPSTCNIVLNLNSVSRQHAVINVLNSKEYMLMDLDSANKTKLLNKILLPYIPHPIKNGDTLQFGDIFGIFRLLEDDDDLPMTQAVDIPETPIQSKFVSKLNKAATTVIPESPDVSDRDDSFLTPAKTSIETTRLSSGQFIKPSKTLTLNRISSPKTNSNFVSSKQSSSFNNHDTSLDESLKNNKNIDNIHEMNTQAPYPRMNESPSSIFTADTQIPSGHGASLSIHVLDTQMPTVDNLPQVRKIDGVQEMQFDIYASNKENNLSIYNAETQPFLGDKDQSKDNCNKSIGDTDVSPEKALNRSNEELLFDEIDDGCLEDFNSQPLLPQESPKAVMKNSKVSLCQKDSHNADADCEDIILTQKVEELKIEPEEMISLGTSKRVCRIESDSSTECEDIESMPTQIISELPKCGNGSTIKIVPKATAKRAHRIDSDSSTDCEDAVVIPTQKIAVQEVNDDITDCEDDFIELNSKEVSKYDKIIEPDDIPTQLVDIVSDEINDERNIEDVDTQIVGNDENFDNNLTQIIPEVQNNIEVFQQPTKDIISPFKIPLQSPLRLKSKENPKISPKEQISEMKSTKNCPNYYNDTQDIVDDLCTQRDGSPVLQIAHELSGAAKISHLNADDEIVPCSVEDYEVRDKFANIDADLSPVKSLGTQSVKYADIPVAKLTKHPSDSSSEEYTRTPKKRRMVVFTDSDLPNSQEIERNIHIKPSISHGVEISSDSETEANTEDQFTPIVHKKKKTKNAKIDLTKKFDVQKLPERIITRVRKPTSKMEGNLNTDKKLTTNILKPKFLTEQEDNIDADIIKENVKRLKTYGRAKSKKSIINDSTAECETKDKKNEIMTKENDELPVKQSLITKEKIKVKIEKPKKKDSKKHKKSKDKAEDLKTEETETNTRTSKEKTNDKSQNETNDSAINLLSVSDTKVYTRSTRNRKKPTDNKSMAKQSKSLDNIEKAPVENNRKRSKRKQEPLPEEYSPEIEIRRSKRQAKAKENSQESHSMEAPKSILKKSIHEQSTVYNLSSSSADSPKNLKRSLTDNDGPIAKKTKTADNNGSNTSTVSLRATPARTAKTQHVLFTAFPSEECKHKLEKIGAVVVTDVMACTVVLTMNVKRTFKLLCAVGLGRPIVGPDWVQACVDTHMIVDPWLYLIKDDAAEKRFMFNLERTLTGKRNFLKGYNVSSTPSVQPNASEMKLIVACSGGVWKEGGCNWVCVSSAKDQALWPNLRKRGATVVTTEFILGGVLRQKLEIIANKFP